MSWREVASLRVGDLGHQVVDARLLLAILLRDGPLGRWLAERGVTREAVERGFGPTGWAA
jgi:hypothetical protein